jgi:ABC-type glycerol-3-phosphate transport system substrate-binding protein
MKLLIASLLVLVGFGSFSAVSAKQAQEISVKINTEEKANGGVRIKFVELVEDSRCPVDTNCIWAGNAKIKVRVTRNGKSKLLELNTMNKGSDPVFAGYKFRLTDLDPDPRTNVRINRNGYVAKIEITKTK